MWSYFLMGVFAGFMIPGAILVVILLRMEIPIHDDKFNRW